MHRSFLINKSDELTTAELEENQDSLMDQYSKLLLDNQVYFLIQVTFQQKAVDSYTKKAMKQQEKQNSSDFIQQFSIGEIVYVETPSSIKKKCSYINKWAMRASKCLNVFDNI